MHLTREEERIYQGEEGESLRRAMEILAALGDIFGAERLIPIKSVQIAGVSFKNIGEAGLEWISEMEGNVAVKSVLNPAGMDLLRWREMGISEEFASRQLAVVEAYRKLGISTDCTCTPYQIHPDMARRGDHLAWSESSAVAYANSVIGARTNREGGPSALAAALVGKTPYYGYHLDENRAPTLGVRVECDLAGSDYGALGHIVGKVVGGGVPLFRLPGRPTQEELKALGAAMAASGSVALFYVEGLISPPADSGENEERMTIEMDEIRDVYRMHSGEGSELVALGCPHCSVPELEAIAGQLRGREVEKELWICTARAIAKSRPDLVESIERSGAKVICDTCMVVSPASERYRKIMVNSGKALNYIPGLCGVMAGFGSTEECLRAATGRD
ncbi:MAG: aconitase X catalytic domain-containing protein [Methanotrichaceae archaeon]|nr:aconitase X catalytic domain-containing protein [Methanotrichaceae archaeon]